MTFSSILVVFTNSQCIPCSVHQSVKRVSAHFVCFTIRFGFSKLILTFIFYIGMWNYYCCSHFIEVKRRNDIMVNVNSLTYTRLNAVFSQSASSMQTTRFIKSSILRITLLTCKVSDWGPILFNTSVQMWTRSHPPVKMRGRSGQTGHPGTWSHPAVTCQSRQVGRSSTCFEGGPTCFACYSDINTCHISV